VRANPNRGGAGRIVLGIELMTANGSRYPLHARALRQLEPSGAIATSIAGTWLPKPEDYLRLAAEMRSNWPLTEYARTGTPTRSSLRLIGCRPSASSILGNSVPAASSRLYSATQWAVGSPPRSLSTRLRTALTRRRDGL
jgi:hypothetical protein